MIQIAEMRTDAEHQRVLRIEDAASGLRAFLAIHSTALGPALGGIRIRVYANDEEALSDALKLSRAMTYKTALAELPAGGGKTVVLDHDRLDRIAAFEALGEAIESLAGEYFSGPDVGVTPADLAAVRRRTRYVADETSPELGNIAEHTAIGVWHAMRACLEFAGVHRARVAIQGVGEVGRRLALILRSKGAELLIADVDCARAAQVGAECDAKLVAPDEIFFADCDVVAPCALGGVINSTTIPKLRTRIVCGSANNVLGDARGADELHTRGVLYAPDYLVNAGGVIRGADFYLLALRDSASSLARIYDRTKQIIELARARDCSPLRIADSQAEERWRAARRTAVS